MYKMGLVLTMGESIRNSNKTTHTKKQIDRETDRYRGQLKLNRMDGVYVI